MNRKYKILIVLVVTLLLTWVPIWLLWPKDDSEEDKDGHAK
jgi:hypothetical protein